MKGIDISNHNGDIDFNKVKSDGVEVVIIKATEGVDYRDNMLEKNYNGALGKLNIGFYHFMSEKTSPSQQACDFYNAIKDKQYNVLPCLDIEVNNYGRSAKEITDRCLEFINKFKELSGKECVIYTGGYFGRDSLDSRIKNYPGWIAHYGVNTPMETGFKVVGHQYSETGRVNGINGNVDMNNFSNEIFLNNNAAINVNAQSDLEENSNIQIAKNYLGSSRNTKKVQYLLNCLGYNLLVDGDCGTNTTNAIEDFQRRNGLVVDYKFGPDCYNKARELLKGVNAGIDYTTPNLTKLIQFILNIKIDGVFWTNTESAVKDFQRRNGLLVDGIVGANTLKVLLGL